MCRGQSWTCSIGMVTYLSLIKRPGMVQTSDIYSGSGILTFSHVLFVFGFCLTAGSVLSSGDCPSCVEVLPFTDVQGKKQRSRVREERGDHFQSNSLGRIFPGRADQGLLYSLLMPNLSMALVGWRDCQHFNWPTINFLSNLASAASGESSAQILSYISRCIKYIVVYWV